MNTTSLVINGRTGVDMALVSGYDRFILPSRAIHRFSPPSYPSKRPQHKRRTSQDSPGWYNTDGGMTLDDFAQRLQTRLSRLEQWQGRCAQNVVMALMRPTPVSLFLFNPVSLLVWMIMITAWFFRADQTSVILTSG